MSISDPTEIIDAGVNRFSRAYVIKGRGSVIVDTGTPGQAGLIRGTLQRNGISKGDVGLILLTHGHGDHTGNAAELKKALGAPIAMGRADAVYLARGADAPVVPCTTAGRLFRTFARSRPVALDVDITIDRETDLTAYGVDAVAFPTPGHTLGSLSVATADGCLIGDLLMATPLVGRTPGYPVFAEDPALIGPSLKAVLGRGPKTLYPGHGSPCDAATVRKNMARLLG